MTALSFEQARGLVIDRVRAAMPAALESESVPLEEADGRVLAEEVRADRDYPPTTRSVRDGFAVRAADLPGPLEVVGESRAGAEFAGVLGPGQAVEIMTGATVPPGADAVIMVEYATREGAAGGVVRFDRGAEPGEAINPRGREARAAQVLLTGGLRLDYARIATLAMVGKREVRVRPRPRVAIVPTGDEVVEITAPLVGDQQVRNSNAWSLAAQVRRAGGTPVLPGIARDEYGHTRALLEAGLTCDLLLVSGGVSAGKYDIVERVLADCGAEFFFDRVKMQPGQPLVFGRARGRFFFGLPGNPLSTLVTFEAIARAAVELLAGCTEAALPFFRVPLTCEFTQRPGLTRFLPAMLAADGASVTPLAWRGSGNLPALARANAFLVTESERERYAAGELIRVMLK